tara:strand:- start:1130 stop:2791 length:1662 start_codon:yes stop_codon:yes gene_type:complete
MFMSQIFGDTDDKRALYEALTRYNYFPNQRANIGELPPSLDTRQFTPEVAEEIAKFEEIRGRRKSGYDLVEYKATRYNNVPRVLGLVHPKGYSLLVKCIHDNWEHLKCVTENVNSIIKPEFHHIEKRLVVMNYEEPFVKISRSHSSSFAKRYRVHADIANCFNSIYSHSIAWAGVGIQEAKTQQDDKRTWFNALDMYQCKTKRNETQGIPIGSAASSIVSELILGKVDEALISKNYEFHRYIDDYTCYCVTSEDAQNFIQDLSNSLAIYKLTLNLKKTSIIELPAAFEDEWVLDLKSALPSRLGSAGENEPKISADEALTFLNKAIGINKSTPDGSVLKYAISLIINYLDEDANVSLLEALLNLAWHYPVLLPLFDKLLGKAEINAGIFEQQLNVIIQENADKFRSDGMSWPLHTMLTNNVIPKKETAEKVIASGDCVAITLLLEMHDFNAMIVEFANSIIAGDDNYEKDSYWLLLYQLYLKDLLIDEPYTDKVFSCLKKHKVNFIPRNTKTKAEINCDKIQSEMTSNALKTVFSEMTIPDVNKNPDEDSAVF